jgi:uncharacterized membrane protein
MTDETHEVYQREGLGLSRIEALTDGVLAIAMTLLVFDLRLHAGTTELTLWHNLVLMWPNLMAFALSFVMLGIYWAAQRSQHHHLHRVDTRFQWINMHFLMFVSLVPFSTRILADFPMNQLALALYGANQIAIGLGLYWMWAYAVRGWRLTDRPLPAFVVRFGDLRCLLAPACYAAALPLMWLSPYATLAVYLSVPALYILPLFRGLWIALARWGTGD